MSLCIVDFIFNVINVSHQDLSSVLSVCTSLGSTELRHPAIRNQQHKNSSTNAWEAGALMRVSASGDCSGYVAFWDSQKCTGSETLFASTSSTVYLFSCSISFITDICSHFFQTQLDWQGAKLLQCWWCCLSIWLICRWADTYSWTTLCCSLLQFWWHTTLLHWEVLITLVKGGL